MKIEIEISEIEYHRRNEHLENDNCIIKKVEEAYDKKMAEKKNTPKLPNKIEVQISQDDGTQNWEYFALLAVRHALKAESDKIKAGDWIKIIGIPKAVKAEEVSENKVTLNSGEIWFTNACVKLSQKAQDILNEEIG